MNHGEAYSKEKHSEKGEEKRKVTQVEMLQAQHEDKICDGSCCSSPN